MGAAVVAWTRWRRSSGTALALIATVVAVALTGGAEARADYWQKCGDQGTMGAGWYNVRAHKVACRNARRVARNWWNSGGDNRFDGWRCRVKSVGYELAKTDCKRFRRGKFQRVKFEHGA